MATQPILLANRISHQIKDTILATKGGYSFFMSLTPWQQAKLLRQIHTIIHQEILSPSYLEAAFKSCLSSKGYPTYSGKLLYNWLKENVFANDARRLFTTWYNLAVSNPDLWSLPAGVDSNADTSVNAGD